MSEPKLISPMLDNFAMGDPISDRGGVRTCPAMNEETGEKYLVKIISSPASTTQLDAFLLTGTYSDKEQALAYYEQVANDIIEEVDILKKLSEMEGFFAFDDQQLVPMDDGNGYDVYLLGSYKRSLAKFFNKEPMTHLSALNLGLDLCAALTVCRRSGYLYVNLKPENIYLTADKGFRIGDIGFVKLDSLKYASLPDRYRSEYTAPEVADAFAPLSTTLDVYAVGLILYRAFNGGQLPNIQEGTTLQAPDYADYEMAEIIMKACDPNPENRWEDPAQMGYALVDYMQRNGAHDTPIVPPTVAVEEPEETPVEENDTLETDLPEEEVISENEAEQVYAEDDSGNLTFMPADAEDETLPGMDDEDLDLDDVSDEVSDILSQADELLSHPTPEPVVAPEPVEVTLPETADNPEETIEQPTEEQPEVANDPSEPVQEVEEQEEPTEEPPKDDADAAEEEPVLEPVAQEAVNQEPVDDFDYEQKPRRHWLRYSIIIFAILALLAAGFAAYKFYYLQNIDSLTCVGEGTTLTVKVKTGADQNLLTVIRTDTYGNKVEKPVINGAAHFDDLEANTPYTIKVTISGFHKLTGKTTTSYVVPKYPEITTFTALTGNEPGSVLFYYTVENASDTKWMIRYLDDNGEEIAYECYDNSATIQGLTVGNSYNFELVPADDIYFAGNNQLSYTARNPVFAEDLYVVDLEDGVLTVAWSTPYQEAVDEWEVHCYNNGNYDVIQTTSENTFAFTDVTESGEYVIEVKANGMSSACQPVTVNTEAVKITDVTVSSSSDNRTILSWDCADESIEGDWRVDYTIDGRVQQTISVSEEMSVVLSPLVPGARYKFTISHGDTSLIGNVVVYTTDAPADFNDFSITKENITCVACKAENGEVVDVDSLNEDDYKTAFPVGESVCVVIALDTYYDRSWADVVSQVVLRDSTGRIVGVSTTESAWRSMWSNSKSALLVPAIPEQAGEYTVSVYFNSAFACEQTITIHE